MLDVRNLRVSVGDVPILRGVDLHLQAGMRMGVVGESGSGKSMTALSIMNLLPDGVRMLDGSSIEFDGANLLGLGEDAMSRVRGRRISMVFQDPMSALNPLMKVGKQIREVLKVHRLFDDDRRDREVLDIIQRVALPEPERIAQCYPHQLSGGQRQRVVIAMALVSNPRLVIADEPTTALDATVRRGILSLLTSLVRERNAALLLISHDLAATAHSCDRVSVMYGGRIVEQGPVEEVLQRPRHPYTRALIGASPRLAANRRSEYLPTIAGDVPGVGQFPSGCAFRDRCPRAEATCAQTPETTVLPGDHLYACWRPL